MGRSTLPQRWVCKTPLCYTHILFFCILLCRNGSAFIDLVFRSKQWLHPVPVTIIDYANMNYSRKKNHTYSDIRKTIFYSFLYLLVRKKWLHPFLHLILIYYLKLSADSQVSNIFLNTFLIW